MVLGCMAGWWEAAVAESIADKGRPSGREEPVPERQILLMEELSAPSWKTSWDEARNLARNKEYSRAIKKYEETLADKPNLEEAQWELVQVYLLVPEHDKALALLEVLNEEDPERWEYLDALARLMLEKGHFRRAQDLFARNLENHPNHLPSMRGLSDALLAQGEKTKALAILEQELSVSPADRHLRTIVASLYFELGRFSEARPHLVVLLGEAHGDLGILRMAAQTNIALGLDEPAAQNWQQIVSKRPSDLEGHRFLAAYFEKKGSFADALPHHLVILKQEPDNASLQWRVGAYYLENGQPGRALPYIENYLRLVPKNKEALQALIRIRSALGGQQGALAAYEEYFAVEPAPNPEYQWQAARLYEGGHDFSRVIALYQRMLTTQPDSPRILEALGKALLENGDDEQALPVWRRLSRIFPERVEVHRTLVGLLSRLHRDDEVIGPLERVHALDPEDQKTAFWLARLYRERGEPEKALTLLNAVAARGMTGLEFHREQACLFERFGWQAKALSEYEKVLEEDPEDHGVRLACLRLAGELGMVSVMERHVAMLDREPERLSGFEVRLVLANGYRQGGYGLEARRRYASLIDSAGQRTKDRESAWIGMAESYQDSGLLLEAEQAYRMAVLEGSSPHVALERLFDLALSSHRLPEAKVWLAELLTQSPPEEKGNLGLLEMKLFVADQEFGKAADKGGELTHMDPDGDHAIEIRLEMARALMFDGKGQEAAQIYDEILAREMSTSGKLVVTPSGLAALVGLANAFEAMHDPEKAAQARARALQTASFDVGILLSLAGVYRAAEQYQEAASCAAEASRLLPESLRAKLYLAEALKKNNDLGAAFDVIAQVQAQYPQNTSAQTEMARLLFRKGNYAGALAQCETMLRDQPERADVILMKARILLAQHKTAEAFQVYQAILQPSVDSLLQTAMAEKNIEPPVLPHKERTFLEAVTFSPGATEGLSELVLSPSFFLAFSVPEPTLLSRISTPLYAQYRWQELFGAELAARESIRDREFNEAVRRLEALVHEDNNDEFLLFDLAGLYSRLGRLGAEAWVYERLAALNPEFPGLSEASERNQLKRQPRVSFGYGWSKEQGWNGYKAMESDSGRVGLWYSPLSQHDFDFAVSRIRHRSTEDDQLFWEKRAMLVWNADFLDELSLSLGGGLMDPENSTGGTGLLDCSVTGRLGDTARSRITVTRDVVSDTYASLTRHIIRQSVLGGASVDILPRWMAGGDLVFGDYSDGNEQQEYGLWTSYVIFSEPTLLRARYAYTYRDFRLGSEPGAPLSDGFGAQDHPYWTPQNYWIKQASLYFKHRLSDEDYERGVPRYYSAEYSLGYDSNGRPIETVAAKLFMEWTHHLSVEAAAELTDSDQFRSKSIFLSAQLRW